MRLLSTATFLLLYPCFVSAEDPSLETVPLKFTPHFNKARVESEVIQRIQSGIYDGYTAELGIDDPKRCEVAAFEPYKQLDGKVPANLLTTPEGELKVLSVLESYLN